MARKIKQGSLNLDISDDNGLDADDLSYDNTESIKAKVARDTLPSVNAGEDGKSLSAYYVTPPEFGDEFDGDVTTSGIINEYSHLTADVSKGATVITVDTVTTDMVVGREIMLHQTQCYRDTDKRFRYEYVRIASIDGNDITLETGLQNAYDSDAGVPTGGKEFNTITQVLTVPNYGTLTLSGTLNCKAWDGRSGGILAFRAKALSGSDTISASAAGFRGADNHRRNGSVVIRGEGPLGKHGVYSPPVGMDVDDPSTYSQSENVNQIVLTSSFSYGSAQYATGIVTGQNFSDAGEYTDNAAYADPVPALGYTHNGSPITVDAFSEVLPFGCGGTYVKGDPNDEAGDGDGNLSGGVIACFVETISGYSGSFTSNATKVTNDVCGSGGCIFVQTPTDPGYGGTFSVNGTTTTNKGGITSSSGASDTGAGSNPVQRGFKKVPGGEARERATRVDSTASVALLETDGGKEIRMDASGTKDISIAEGALDTYPDYATTRIVNAGPDTNINFVVTGSVTMTGVSAIKPGEVAILQKIAADTYHVTLEAVADATINTATGRKTGTQGADVASAADITLGDGNYFDITGTATINSIDATDWTPGSMVVLQFDAAATVAHNVAATYASVLLSGSANFVASAGDTLTLVYDGTTWREVARTVI